MTAIAMGLERRALGALHDIRAEFDRVGGLPAKAELVRLLGALTAVIDAMPGEAGAPATPTANEPATPAAEPSEALTSMGGATAAAAMALADHPQPETAHADLLRAAARLPGDFLKKLTSDLELIVGEIHAQAATATSGATQQSPAPAASGS